MTYRTNFDKINDEYDLKQLVKRFFFTDVYKRYIKEHGDLMLRCKNKSKNVNSKTFKPNNGRMIIQSKCVECGFKKSRFVKNKKQKVY